MKYAFQFCRILAVCLLGEILAHFLPLPIPASVYGLVLMLAVLKLRILELEQGKKTTNTDDRYFKKAEDNLHGELAMALGMEKSDMEEFITSRFYQEAES